MNKILKDRSTSVLPWKAKCGDCGVLTYWNKPMLHKTRKQAKDVLHQHMVEVHGKAGNSLRG